MSTNIVSSVYCILYLIIEKEPTLALDKRYVIPYVIDMEIGR